MTRHSMTSKPLLALCIATACTPAFAGDAVSSLNGKLEAMGGKVNSNDASAIMGSLTAPLGSRYGVQLDALSADINSTNASGYGLHAFWRDSDRGMAGLTGSQVKTGGNQMNRVGVEGEVYLPNLTVAGEIGQQRGDVPKAEYGSLDLTWYANDNLALNVGASKADSFNKQHLGVEYQTPLKGLALFADAASGDNGYDHVMGGLTYYFGGNKSLKQRHRQDDPQNPLFDAVMGLEANVPAPVTTDNGGSNGIR
ncbi:MAG TPA: hypothetical protein PLE99_06640 [Candidatus Thiothrix moscowensis]|uniref:hypothetical protein n=2 Tax=Thiothrix TaxID=1030 RepID=UPI0025E68069|nr:MULTISPECIES: hypothetical protein [unclassified Thiothrix]HRJ52424.1 hypothetical protein [Candidatus Thiothrix moscowensis]HRJ92739.1 hypothetical protein [Candidatus Thiothrix moscowensis]